METTIQTEGQATFWEKHGTYVVFLIITFIVCFAVEYFTKVSSLISSQITSIVFAVIGLMLLISSGIYMLIKTKLTKSEWLISSQVNAKIIIKTLFLIINGINGAYLGIRFEQEATPGIPIGISLGVVGIGFIVIARIISYFRTHKKIFTFDLRVNSNSASHKKYDVWLENKNGLVSIFIEKLITYSAEEVNEKIQNDDIWQLGLSKALTFLSLDEWKFLIEKLDDISLNILIRKDLLHSFLRKNPEISLLLTIRKHNLDNVFETEKVILERAEASPITLDEIRSLQSNKLRKQLGDAITNQLLH